MNGKISQECSYMSGVMAQGVLAFAAQHGDLSLILRIHMVAGDNWFL